MNPQQTCSIKDEWFTPPWFMERVQRSIGIFYWDLATSEKARRLNPSANYFTIESPFQENHQDFPEWRDCFYCNPPFSKAAIFAEIIAREGKHGIVLCNANTDSGWFQTLAKSADYLVSLNKRIAFIDSETLKPVTSNPKGQAVFLWGCQPKYFQDIGLAWRLQNASPF